MQATRPAAAKFHHCRRGLEHRLAELFLHGQALAILTEAVTGTERLARGVGVQVAGTPMHLVEGLKVGALGQLLVEPAAPCSANYPR